VLYPAELRGRLGLVRHRHPLGDAGKHQVSHGPPPEVMHDTARASSGHAGRRAGLEPIGAPFLFVNTYRGITLSSRSSRTVPTFPQMRRMRADALELLSLEEPERRCSRLRRATPDPDALESASRPSKDRPALTHPRESGFGRNRSKSGGKTALFSDVL
jgi:hypothetical protein